MAEPAWLPMALVPRDRRITIRAERWIVANERMRVAVFERCKWCVGGTVRQPVLATVTHRVNGDGMT